MAGPAPGFIKYPEHQVKIEPSASHVRVRVGDTVIADTREAVLVRESRHEPAWYLPMASVDPSVIEATATSTYCPFKGDASYWSIRAGGKTLPDSMWSYQAPFDECLPIAGHVAFYADRVTVEVDP